MSERPSEAMYEFARTVLRDKAAPPVLVLAAWRCLFWGEDEPFRTLCLAALAQIDIREEAARG